MCSNRIPWDDLVWGREYKIKKDGIIYKGINIPSYITITINYNEPTTFTKQITFIKVTPNPENKKEVYFDKCDEYYDWDKIRDNARKARIAFEQRALNQILKRVVNEEFKWI